MVAVLSFKNTSYLILWTYFGHTWLAFLFYLFIIFFQNLFGQAILQDTFKTIFIIIPSIFSVVT